MSKKLKFTGGSDVTDLGFGLTCTWPGFPILFWTLKEILGFLS